MDVQGLQTSRIQNKYNLRSCKNRLAANNDHVMCVKTRNSKLTQKPQKKETTQVLNSPGLFKPVLNLRDALRQNSKENSLLKSKVKRLKMKLIRSSEVNTNYCKCLMEFQNLKDINQKLNKELTREKINVINAQLIYKKEILQRIIAENKLKSREKVYKQKLNGIRTRNVIRENEIKSAELHLQHQQTEEQRFKNELKYLEEALQHQETALKLVEQEKKILELKRQKAGSLMEYQSEIQRMDQQLTSKTLLESEEKQSNITSDTTVVGSTSSKNLSPFIDYKAQCYKVIDNTPNTSIIISEVCPFGQYVQLKNIGPEEITLSGCKINRSIAGLTSMTTFYFNFCFILGAHKSLTIWSSNVKNQKHDPSAGTIVMPDKVWVVGHRMCTSLLNYQGKEAARHDVLLI